MQSAEPGRCSLVAARELLEHLPIGAAVVDRPQLARAEQLRQLGRVRVVALIPPLGRAALVADDHTNVEASLNT